jgi:tetratricopeptide (TPR) repeat protein
MHELAGDLELALADVDRALELEPQSNRLLVYRSRLKQRLGRDDEALADFGKALKIIPESEVDWISRGLARANRDPQGALDDLKQALKLNPRSTAVLQNIAFIQSDKLQDDSASIDTLNRLLLIDPSFELARSGRCVPARPGWTCRAGPRRCGLSPVARQAAAE